MRAVGRDITKPSMLAIQSIGATLAAASFDDPESLSVAFKDAYAIFGNTTFAATRSVEAETAQGTNIVDSAAKVSSLKHFIWSGAADTKGMSQNKYDGIVHMQAKAHVQHYMAQRWPSLAAKTTTVVVQSYFENWTNLPGLFGPLKASLYNLLKVKEYYS